MNKRWMPITAGVLDIISGVFSFPAAFLTIFFFMDPTLSAWAIWLILLLLIAGILAIAGGILALMRRQWVLALTGSVAAVFVTWPVAIVAVVFTVMSRNQFR